MLADCAHAVLIPCSSRGEHYLNRDLYVAGGWRGFSDPPEPHNYALSPTHSPSHHITSFILIRCVCVCMYVCIDYNCF
jgi:hypothetical protein